jgi:hypothetical protein
MHVAAPSCAAISSQSSASGLDRRWLYGRSWAAAVIFVLAALTVWSARAAEHAAVSAALESITVAELQRHVAVLADDAFEGREAGSRGGHAAASYLATFFQEHGLEAAGERGSYFQPFGPGYRNVLGRLEGSDAQLKGEYVLVGAHFDHVGYGNSGNSLGPTGYIHNGADDNSSGVAAVLELIDAYRALGHAPRRSIVFALWDGEEKGLLGSKHWAAAPTVPLSGVAFALNMDMVGRLRNERIEVHGVRTGTGLRELVARANTTAWTWLDFTWELKPNSDHYTLFEHRIPVIMLHTGLHDDYHRPSDDVEKVNLDGMRRVTALAFELTLSAADDDQRPVWRGVGAHESVAAQRQFERPLDPLPPRLGVAWTTVADEGPVEGGLVISRVTAGSAAARAELRPGDTILALGDWTIDDQDRFRSRILAAQEPVVLHVRREGKSEPEPVRVTLDGRASPDSASPTAYYLIRVVPGSPADRAGLRAGQWLYEVNGRRYASSDDLVAALLAAASPMEVLIEERGRLRSVEMHAD